MPAPSPPDPSPGSLSSQAQSAPPPAPPRIRFADLAGEAVEVEVEHAGQIYRLRRTRQGKLLLTK